MDGDPRQARILFVEDDADVVSLLAFLAEQEGLVALSAREPITALEIFENEHPTLAVVDLNLRPWDGVDLVAELRRRSPTIPIIVLSGRTSEDDKVRALDSGADDYVVKPFGPRELVARIRAHLRRAAYAAQEPPLPAVLEVGALRMHVPTHTVEVDGHAQRLTATEFRVLHYLMRNSDAIVPAGRLAKHVWGYDDSAVRGVLRVTVHRLRKKLGDDGTAQRFIYTVPGVGHKLLRAVGQRSS